MYPTRGWKRSFYYITLNTNKPGYVGALLIQDMNKLFLPENFKKYLVYGSPTNEYFFGAPADCVFTINGAIEEGEEQGRYHAHYQAKVRHHHFIKLNIEELRADCNEILHKEYPNDNVHLHVRAGRDNVGQIDEYINKGKEMQLYPVNELFL